MAITKCEECGYEITLKTDSCPGCGEAIARRRGTLRRLIFRLILILVIVYLIMTSLRMFN